MLAGLCDGVVALVSRHLDTLALLARQNVVAPVAFVVNILCAHERPHAAVLIVLLQFLPIVRLVIVQVE